MNKTAATKILTWLKTKRIDNCPACKSATDGVKVGFTIAPPEIDLESGMISGKYSVPMVIVSCLNCGHAMLFVAKEIGLLPNEDEDKLSS